MKTNIINRISAQFGIVALSSILFCGSSLAMPGNSGDGNPVPHPKPAARTAKIVTTSADGTFALTETSVPLRKGAPTDAATINIDLNKKFQEIDGFGFAITYSSCYNLLKMSAEDRAALLKRTYSTREGYGVSYARVSIGCNDFSSTEYSLCDKPGIENFALQSDEVNYVIPILKEILAINPNVKIIGAPWTCPKWMKVSDITTKSAHDSWTDGHLNPDFYDAYAQYFVKFITEMKKNGIDIYAISPQNEPLNRGNCASLYLPWQEEAEFVKFLAAQLSKNGLNTKIYVFDHNYHYDNIADQDDYPVRLYNAVGNRFEGSELVVGAAYHNYGGSSSDELLDIHGKAPDKELIFSETSIGTWNNGRDLTKRLIADMENVALGTVNKYCKAVIVWNFMLDDQRGPNLDGGCQTCYGAVDISKKDYKTLTYNSHYYIITHMSAVVAPGAVRLGNSSSKATDSGIIHAEFLNPDGTKAAVMLNNGNSDRQVSVSDGKRHFTCNVPAKSVVSCKWKK